MAGSLPQYVAAEVRAQLARKRISGTALAEKMNVSGAYISRRLTGEVPFDVADLEQIGQILDVPAIRFLEDADRSAA